MAISAVGSYADSSKTESTTKTRQAPASTTLTMDNFMLLLAAELQNQDMSSPMSNSEMMAQLTSMATVQSMNTFSELSSTQYALNLMGKEVTVASTNKETGKMEMKKGVVAGINLSNMTVFIEGDEAEYGLGNIMEVGKVPAPKEDEDNDDDPGKTPGGTDPEDKTDKETKAAAEKKTNTDTKTAAESSKRAADSSDPDKINNSAMSRAAAYATDPQTEGSNRSNLQEAYDYRQKTYTDTSKLRVEYLASDKREALAQQYEIPEDKRRILADEALNQKARGPAASTTVTKTDIPQQAAEQRQQPAAERQQAVTQPQQPVAERQQTVTERQQAVAERQQAVTERQQTSAERSQEAGRRPQIIPETITLDPRRI